MDHLVPYIGNPKYCYCRNKKSKKTEIRLTVVRDALMKPLEKTSFIGI